MADKNRPLKSLLNFDAKQVELQYDFRSQMQFVDFNAALALQVLLEHLALCALLGPSILLLSAAHGPSVSSRVRVQEGKRSEHLQAAARSV